MLENSSKSFNDINYFGVNNNNNEVKGKIILNLLRISDFFNNEEFNIKLINEIILPYNFDNIIIDLLNYSYKKLCVYSEKNIQINNVYFDLFYKSLECISRNENLVLNNLNKIKCLDVKIIDEIVEKTFQNLIDGNTLLIDKLVEINKKDNYEYDPTNNTITSSVSKNKSHLLSHAQFKKLINFLMEIKNKKNFFDLLTSEYAFLLSKESINELKNLPHPSLQVKIHFSEYSFYSQEFPLEITLNNKKIILIISYKKEDQSFNICIKLSNNINKKINCNSILEIDKIYEEQFNEENSCFKILTFLSHIIITKGPEKIKISTQNNVNSLSNNKKVYTILKISNFDNELRNFLIREPSKEYFSVIVQIKLCYIYSALASYLLNEFPEYSKDSNICKISKQLLIIILENKYLNKRNDNDIVKTILLWLQDEINIKEDISSIFSIINWEKIEDDLIFELIIKYSHIIVGNKFLEKIFIDAFEKKYNNTIIIGNILKSLFCAGQKIEYCKIFSKMKKSEKYSKSYKYFNSEAKFKGAFLCDFSSLSKDSNSLKEGLNFFLLNKSNNNKKEKKNEKDEKEVDNLKKLNDNTINSDKNNNKNEVSNQIINSNKKSDEKINIKSIKNLSLNNKQSNNIINKEKDIHKKTDSNIINRKKTNEQIIFNKNNAIFLKKNLLNLNRKEYTTLSNSNLNKKNIKVNNIKKLSFSYFKNIQNESNLSTNKNNISNVSININNINNINISNNNYSNYKTQNNEYILKNDPNKNKENSISLSFINDKSQKKLTKTKNDNKKNKKNLNNFPIKLFSTGNNDNNNNFIKINNIKYNKKSNNNLINEKNNRKNKSPNIPKKYNNLLSTILSYEKIVNKSTFGNSKNKNNVSIKKMIVYKSQKKLEKPK